MEIDSPESQVEVEDIEDLLCVLGEVVTALRQPALAEVDLQCLMYKFAHLETAILVSLERSTQQTANTEEQSLLADFIERYSRLGPDYQSSWSQRYWDAYSVATQGHKQVTLDERRPSLRQLCEKLQQVQELAVTLTHLTTSEDSRRGSFQRSNPAIASAAQAFARQLHMVSKSSSEPCCHCGVS